MANPTTGEGGPSFDFPPVSIDKLDHELYQYLTMLHTILFKARDGLRGILDGDNIIGDLTDTDTTDHAQFDNVTAYQHHGAGQHALLDQASSVADASTSAVSVTSPDASGAYAAAEQTLINELKADLNTLVSDVNSIANTLNTLINRLENADLLAS